MKHKSTFVKNRKILFFLLMILPFLINAQVPAGGAVDVAINTTFEIPSTATSGLIDGVDYDLVVLTASNTQYDNIDVNAFDGINGVSGIAQNLQPNLVYYSDYSWVVVPTGADGTNAANHEYGPFAFTTVGPTVTLTGGGLSIAENGGFAILTATASATIGKDMDITVTYTGTSLSNGTDFTNSGGAYPTETITILSGTGTGATTITGTADTFLEGDETVIGTINASSSYVVGGSAQTITITDANTITLSGSTSIPETGGSATLTATVDGGGTLSLNGGGALTLNVAYGGTATNGTDYTNVSSFTIANGAASGTFDVNSISDYDVESDETVNATISTLVSGVSFLTSSQIVTILDDDFLTAPVNGQTGVSVEPTFTWITPNFGGATYTVKIATSGANQAAFDGSVIATETGIGGLTYTFTEAHLSGAFPLTNNLKYYWQVTPTGGTASEIFHFTTVPSVPVTLTLPLNGSVVNMTNVRFYWYIVGSQGGMKFKIQVKESALAPTATEWLTPDFTTTTFNTNYQFTLLQGKNYYWRVIVLSSSNEVIDYSTAWSFTTGGGASVTPYQTWPIGGVTLYTNAPTLYWYLATYAPGVTFQVKYSTSGTFGGLVDPLELDAGTKYPTDVNMPGSGSTNLYLTLPALNPGVQYYWQVRVFYPSTSEFGPWSSIESFVTHGSGTLLKPILSYPTNNVKQYTTAPTLYWYVLGQGSGLTYDVYYREFGAGAYTGPFNTTNLYYQLSGLTAGKQYQWYVESNNGSSTMSSDVETFHITGGVSNGYPVITWPVGNPTVYTTKPSISWFIEGSQLGLTGVVLRYKEGSNSADWNTTYDGSIFIPITNLSYTFTFALNEGSTYYFALAATDGTNYSAWDEDAFTIYTALSNISDPVLTSPVGGITLGTKSPTLYWYVIGDLNAIASYEVTYSTSDVFASGATTVVGSILNPYLALSGLTPGATYYWKVRSLYTNSSYSNYSVTETFRIDPGASAIQPIIGGPNNVTVNTTTPTISWVLPSEHSSSIMSEIIIADNPDMINSITIEGIESNQFEIADLEIGKSYFWKARTKTSDNIYSEYSGQGVFKVGVDVTAVNEENIIPEKFEVSQNYPNPFNPSTVIKYGIPESQFVTLRIYNMLGQEVITLVNREVDAGTYNVTWNGIDNTGAKVATGTYIYRVVAGNSIVTKKMILLK